MTRHPYLAGVALLAALLLSGALGTTWVDVDGGMTPNQAAKTPVPVPVAPAGVVTDGPRVIPPPPSPEFLPLPLDYVWLDPALYGINVFPWYPYYNGFRIQHLYLGSEIGRSGTIMQIALYKTYAYTDAGIFPNVSVKMCTTSVTALTSSFSNNYGGNKPVWVFHQTSGFVRGGAAYMWDTVALTTPFVYNNTSNLLVEVTWTGTASGLYCYAWYNNYGGSRRAYASNITDTLVPTANGVDYCYYNTRIGFRGVPNDVGVSQIMWPSGPFCIVDTIRPVACRVTNFGTANQASVPVTCRIRDGIGGPIIYNQTVNVSISAGATVTVNFPLGPGDIAPLGHNTTLYDSCWTDLATDVRRYNDTMASEITVYNCLDAATISVDSPVGTVCGRGTYNPKATVQNLCPKPRSFDVKFLISDGYSSIVTTPMLAPNEVVQLTFDPWHPAGPGTFETKCTTMLGLDKDNSNDSKTGSVKVLLWPAGWVEMAPVPFGPRDKGIKDGAWLAHKPMDDYVYAIKGDRTDEFYRYDIEGNGWSPLAPILAGREDKLPYSGARGVRDDGVYIYATKGANTPGFWRYDILLDEWTQLADVPERPNGNTKVDGGTDVTYVPSDDGSGSGGYVYLLKGRSGEFYRYNVDGEAWDPELPHAPPAGGNAVWEEGSYITYDGDKTIYAYRSYDMTADLGGNEVWTFDLVTQMWSEDPLPGIPGLPPTASQDGGCGDWWGGSVWTLKGGDTREFYRYTPPADWDWLDEMPKEGANKQPRNIFWGADIIAHGCGAFFAFKGHDTPEFWRYVYAPEGSEGGQSAVTGRVGDVGMRLTLTPSPLAGSVLHIEYGLAKAGPASLTIFDVSGRAVAKRDFAGVRAGELPLDLRYLSGGIYLVRLDDGQRNVVQKLVVQR